MHEGEDTRFFLDAGADVVAFEANEELVKRNRRRFRREIERGQLRIVFGAIVERSSSGETVPFFINDDKSVFSTAKPEWDARNRRQGFHSHRTDVPAIHLDEILADLRKPFAAKIDIEGADRLVVDEIARADWTPDYLSIESEKGSFEKLKEEIQTLYDMGYRQFAAVQQATIPKRRVSGRRLDSGARFQHRFRKHASGPFGPFLAEEVWKTADEVVEDYRNIFRQYRRFGDRSYLMRHRLTRLPTRLANWVSIRALGLPLCGWYDTHARL